MLQSVWIKQPGTLNDFFHRHGPVRPQEQRWCHLPLGQCLGQRSQRCDGRFHPGGDEGRAQARRRARACLGSSSSGAGGRRRAGHGSHRGERPVRGLACVKSLGQNPGSGGQDDELNHEVRGEEGGGVDGDHEDPCVVSPSEVKELAIYGERAVFRARAICRELGGSVRGAVLRGAKSEPSSRGGAKGRDHGGQEEASGEAFGCLAGQV